jgi:hypothetical protein
MMGDLEYTRYMQVMRASLQVMEELNLMVLPFYETIQEQITSNYTISLPKDTIKVLRVGTLSDSGQFYPLGEDESMRRVQRNISQEDPNCEEDASDSNLVTASGDAYSIPVSDICFFNFNSRGGYYGEYYGLKNRQFLNGTWRHNKQINVLEFGTGGDIQIGQTVLIEYKKAMGADAHRLVPVEWKNAIYFRVIQLLSAFADPGASRAHYQQFVTEYRNVKRQALRMNAKDMLAMIEEQRQGGPKY